MSEEKISIGALYSDTHPLLIWADPFYYNVVAVFDPHTPFLIIDKFEDPKRHEYWIKVLVEEKVGWIKSTFFNIMWIDPEDHL